EDFNGNNMSTTIQLAADLNDPSLNVFEQALTVLGYLSTHYTYDYDMLQEGSMDTPSENEDYVEWFLERGSGVSIHFAMAMTTLLNLENIAARVVTGFVYGDQDPGSRIRNVRALYIHSWVEVYIPTDPVTGEGRWVGFDPGEHPAADLLANPKDPNVVRSDYDITIISTNPDPPIVTEGDSITITAMATSGNPPIPQQGVPITFENMNTSQTIGTVSTNIFGISSINYDTTGLDPGMHRIRAYFGTVEDIIIIYVTPPYTLTVWANTTVINQGDPLTIYAQVNDDGGSPEPGAPIDFDDLNSAWSALNIITNGSGIASVIIDGADTSSWIPGEHTIRARWPAESLINFTLVGVWGQPDPMSIGENPVNPLETSTDVSSS
ncbi:MAG: transglutaminase family protein, partial [Candidatus Hodarchaeota archaeon]